jgi:hypothetical protein
MRATPELEGYEQSQTGEQYQALLQEVTAVLEGEHPQSAYHVMSQDTANFSFSLASKLRERQDELIRICDDAPQAFATYQEPYDYPALVEKFLSSPEMSQERHKSFLLERIDVFGAFEGRWSGVWYNNSQAVGAFDHHWQKTRARADKEHILIQPVVMGRIPIEELQNRTPKKIGSDSKEPTPAVDAVSSRSGWIIGAVGFNSETQRTSRPHVGYLWFPHLLVWVALEPNGTPEEPRYSCFFERRYEDKSYRIIGVQFLWHRMKQHLSFECFMGGVYQSPL